MQEEYKQTLDDAKNFAEMALSRINEEKLPATPDIFELFYSYYSKNNAEVVRSIDIVVSQNFELTLERCQELHKRLLNTDSNKETLAVAERVVGETLNDVDSMCDTVKASNKDFSGSMASIHESISDTVSSSDFKNLFVEIMTETQKMISENRNLEQKLESSSSKMKELKDEIQAVREEAYIDSLTRISNRKKFDIEIENLVAQSRQDSENLSLIFLDIDHFKSFNDAYGHQIGDQVLRLVAKSLQEGLKGQDFAYRYGGEEFVCLLPKTDEVGAARVAENMRTLIKSKEIKNKKTDEVLTRITISSGVAQLHENEVIQEWIERADSALYQAKRKGRDCVVVNK